MTAVWQQGWDWNRHSLKYSPYLPQGMASDNGHSRREVLGMITGALGFYAIGGGLSGCGAGQQHLRILHPNDLSKELSDKLGVCVGVGDVSSMGASYYPNSESMRTGVQRDAIRDFYARCDIKEPSPQEFGSGLEVYFLSGGSVDQSGEKKGLAAIAVPEGAIKDGETIRGISSQYGVLYRDLTPAYHGEPLGDE